MLSEYIKFRDKTDFWKISGFDHACYPMGLKDLSRPNTQAYLSGASVTKNKKVLWHWFKVLTLVNIDKIYVKKSTKKKRKKTELWKFWQNFSETINIKTIMQLRKMCYETNQTTLIGRSTVLSLTPQLAFPDLTRESSLKGRA